MKRNVAKIEVAKVLIVEDDPTTAREISDYFSLANDFEVVGIADGATKALELLKETRPAVVILDIALKEGHGLPLLRELTSKQHVDYEPCIVAVTEQQSDRLHEKLYDDGVSYIFGKYEDNYSIPVVAEFLRGMYTQLPLPQETELFIDAMRKGDVM